MTKLAGVRRSFQVYSFALIWQHLNVLVSCFFLYKRYCVIFNTPQIQTACCINRLAGTKVWLKVSLHELLGSLIAWLSLENAFNCNNVRNNSILLAVFLIYKRYLAMMHSWFRPSGGDRALYLSQPLCEGQWRAAYINGKIHTRERYLQMRSHSIRIDVESCRRHD